jgi:hypothetical protein
MMPNMDSLISFVGIMLGLSLAITVINQVLSNVLALRGAALRWGMMTMLTELYRKDRIPHLEQVVDFILHHPLISDSATPHDWTSFVKTLTNPKTGFVSRLRNNWHVATALTFDELDRILKLSAKPETDISTPTEQWGHEESIKWLSQNLSLTNEWFSSTMNRVGQRFALHMRLCTVFSAFLLVFFTHIDTFQLFTELSQNPQAVAKFNVELDKISQGSAPDSENVQQMLELNDSWKNAGVEVVPRGIMQHFPWSLARVSPDLSFGERVSERLSLALGALDGLRSTTGLKHFFGMLLTAALLSLGAPFWFNQLKNVSSLKTVVAQKAEQAANK